MNSIFFTQAWDNSRNIGKYYNEFMQMLPDNAWGCLMDYDVMFLTNDFGKHIYEYAKRNPTATLTCRTNRLHITNDFQQVKEGVDRDCHDINYHKQIAEERKKLLYLTTDISRPKANKLMGGMLMLVNKEVWKDNKFDETGILDVDNNFHKKLISNGQTVLVMEGIYIYHWYRQDGSKKHLL